MASLEFTEEQKKAITRQLDEIKLSGMRVGAIGILGYVLDMCKTGKSVGDIRRFCEKSLNQKGMKE